jgi:hypothetical protein
MNLFAILGVILLGSSVVYLFCHREKIEITFKDKVGVSIACFFIAYVLYKLFGGLFKYLWVILYVILGIMFIVWQWNTTRKISDIIKWNREGALALILAILGMVCFTFSKILP